MIPILYEKNETDFTNNGLARLRDCISCIVTEERNGIYECDFEYPVGGANYDLIECGRIIAVTHDETDDVQPFDIVSYSRPIDGIVSFHAVHISYRQSKLTVSGTNINSLQDALTLLTTAQPSNPFGYWTDKTSDALFAAADGVPRSVKQMLGGMEGSILDCYGGEYEWDKWTVRLWGARGVARDFAIRYGVNLTGYEEEVNYSDTYTSCIPYWIGSDDNGDIIIQGNKVSTNEVPYDGHEACVPLDLTDKFEEQPTTQQLEDMAAEMMANDKVFIPAQTIKVEFIRLQDSPDYENYASLMECRLCDSVNVFFSKYGVSGSFKIVKTVYNVLQDKYDEMELGTLSVTLSSAIDGGSSSPSVSDVSVIRMAAEAQNDANIANGILISMDEAAQAAHTTLEGIYADAENSKNLLSDMEDAATAAQTTLTGIYADAETAKTQAASALSSATTALTAAQSAQANADAALVSLANVEDVVGVLDWITAHGTMTLTSDVAINPAHVYFVVDPTGDYVVGGTHYSIVAEPKVEDISTYYELSIDESVQNYVATHVVVDTEGLWLIPDSGGNKVLIATGAGSSYTTAGTYIIGKVNGVDTIFAKFTADKATIGSPSKSHFDVSTNGIKLTDIWGDAYLNIQDYRVGQYEIDQYFVGDGSRAQFNLIVEAISTSDMNVRVNGTAVTSGITKNVKYVAFNTAPVNGSEIEVTYRSRYGAAAKAYTMGTRADGSLEGEQSVAIGKRNVASGVNSIAIGSQAEATDYASKSFGTLTKATNLYSHAEGWSSVAGGQMSHAQNRHTIASGDSQTALGKFNVADNSSAIILGNGTADNARSNALTVDWNGNVNIASGAKYKINGSNLSASNVGALPISGGTMTSNGQIINGHITNSSSRETTPNLTPTGKRGITALLASGTMTTARPGEGTIIHCEWDTNAGWNSQLFIADNDSGNGKPFVAVRGQRSGTWTAWDRLLAQSDVTDYVIAQSQSTTSYGNGYWRWREWNSGKVEIWYHGSLTLTTSESDSNGVKRYSRWFNFPNSYSLYRCTCIVNGMDQGGWYGCGGVRDSSGTVNAEPTRALQVMGYRIQAQPPTTPSNLNIYICGQKTI